MSVFVWNQFVSVTVLHEGISILHEGHTILSHQDYNIIPAMQISMLDISEMFHTTLQIRLYIQDNVYLAWLAHCTNKITPEKYPLEPFFL